MTAIPCWVRFFLLPQARTPQTAAKISQLFSDEHSVGPWTLARTFAFCAVWKAASGPAAQCSSLLVSAECIRPFPGQYCDEALP